MDQMHFASPEKLLPLLNVAWSRETSSDGDGWQETNRAWGQCAITALLIQERFGGTLRRCKANLPDGQSISHYFNLIDGRMVDLTRQQFPAGTTFTADEERTREYVLSFPETAKRYGRLISVFLPLMP